VGASRNIGLERQVGEGFIAGETLHGLSKHHHLLRRLIRIRAARVEAGA
jgi:hypothetical protein